MKAIIWSAVRACVLGAVFVLPTTSEAIPVATRFTGTVFSEPPSDPFGSDVGDPYVMLINYDPALLAGVLVGDFTRYQSLAGQSLITFSWTSAADHFTSDNSFPVTIFINN